MAQTWHTFPANCSDSARKSGSMKVPMKTTCHHPGFKVTSRELCLKSAKNLCLRHRFFDEIRQIHRFFDIFRQILQILCRNQARGGRAVGAPPVWRETPSASSAFAQENPVPTRSGYRAEGTYGTRRVTRCRQRLPELQRWSDQHRKRLAKTSR